MALVCVLVFDFAIRNSTMTVMTLCCRHLVKINLSYNHIETLAGFQAMRGSGFDLEQIELQGNKLQSISHVGLCLQVCVCSKCQSMKRKIHRALFVLVC